MLTLFMVLSSEVMTTKLKSQVGSRSNNHYSYIAVVRELFTLSFWDPTVSVTEVTGTAPIFYPGAPMLDGSLEAAGFVSVLWRQSK